MSSAINDTPIDSSIFGQAPDDWRVDRIRDRLCGIVGGEWGDDPDAHDDGVEVPVIRVADIRDLDITVDGLTIRRIKESKLAGRLINNRTILIEKSGGGENKPVGRAVRTRMVKCDAICSNFMAKVDCGDTIDPSFIVYTLDALYSCGVNGACIQQTTGIQNLRVLDYLNTKVAFPERSEQHRIASYLDKTCATIDTAIEKKQKQLETLDALRKSIIHKAVTRGLDDSVEVKDSGVEWLGNIPVHWQIKRIKDIVDLKSGDAITSDSITPIGNYPVFGGNGLRGYTISYTHDGYYVLIGRQGALCGNINYAEGKFWASEHAVVAIALKKHDTLWLGELLRVMNLNQYSNAAAQPGLAVDRIKYLRIPIPPYEEQLRITSWLKNTIIKNEAMISILQKQIDTLTAYRKALIHECVTGKRRITEAHLKEIETHV